MPAPLCYSTPPAFTASAQPQVRRGPGLQKFWNGAFA
jgi:hypothetical protein